MFILNKANLNILSSFISHEKLTVDDKENKKSHPREKRLLIKVIEIVKTPITHLK